MSTFKTFYLGILAGCYIAFGSCLAMTVGGASMGLVASGNPGILACIRCCSREHVFVPASAGRISMSVCVACAARGDGEFWN